MKPLISDSDQKEVHSSPIWLLAIVSVAAVLAWPAMSAPILLDDEDTFRHVANFTGWADVFKADVFGLFRPVKTSIYYAFSQQPELNLKLWHTMVLSSFLISVIAVFGMLRKLLRSDAGALLGAAMWALTPTQACVAIWMSCINISLCVTMLCLFIVLHLNAAEKGENRVARFFPAAGALFLAQCSYETAVSGIALAVLIDWLLPSKRPLALRVRAYVCYGAVTIAFLGIRLWAGSSMEAHNHNLGFEPDLEPWKQSVSSPWFALQHLLMWLAPLGRIEFASTYIWGKSASMLEIAIAWIVMLGFLVTAWGIRRRTPMISLGMFWFLGTLFPCSNLVPISSGPIDDYYLIIPSIGLVISVIGILHLCVSRTPLQSSGPLNYRAGLLTIIACLLVWRASLVPFFGLQCSLWKNPLELFSRSAASRDHQFLTKTLAARELLQQGFHEDAAKLASEAASEGTWHPGALVVQGLALSRLERQEEALAVFNKLFQFDSMDRRFLHVSLIEVARIHGKRGDDWKLSRDALLPILEGDPDNYQIQAIHLLADIYATRDMKDRAIATLNRGIELHPGHTAFTQQREEIQAP